MIDMDSISGKPKTIYIWEGNNTTAITKGLSLLPYENEDGEQLYATKYKYKGFTKKFESALNLSETIISPPTRLISDNRVVEGWEVVKIYMDVVDKTANNSHPNFALLARMQSLINERNRFRKLYLEERRKNRTLAGEDRFNEHEIKSAKHHSKVRNELYGGSGYDPWTGGLGGWRGGIQNPEGGNL